MLVTTMTGATLRQVAAEVPGKIRFCAYNDSPDNMTYYAERRAMIENNTAAFDAEVRSYGVRNIHPTWLCLVATEDIKTELGEFCY